jgi:ATP-dependent Clp protease ATP-binding subunit ClpC
MRLAEQEAKQFSHAYLCTDDILIALVREGTGVAAIVLKKLGVEVLSIRHAVEKIRPTDDDRVIDLSSLPRLQVIAEYSLKEAYKLGRQLVDTEHLLLGLLRYKEGLAVHALRSLGLTLHTVREEIIDTLKNQKSEAS